MFAAPEVIVRPQVFRVPVQAFAAALSAAASVARAPDGFDDQRTGVVHRYPSSAYVRFVQLDAGAGFVAVAAIGCAVVPPAVSRSCRLRTFRIAAGAPDHSPSTATATPERPVFVIDTSPGSTAPAAATGSADTVVPGDGTTKRRPSGSVTVPRSTAHPRPRSRTVMRSPLHVDAASAGATPTDVDTIATSTVERATAAAVTDGVRTMVLLGHEHRTDPERRRSVCATLRGVVNPPTRDAPSGCRPRCPGTERSARPGRAPDRADRPGDRRGGGGASLQAGSRGSGRPGGNAERPPGFLRGPFLTWCARGDLNPHAVSSTRT